MTEKNPVHTAYTAEVRKGIYNMGISQTRPVNGGCDAREIEQKSSYFSCAKYFLMTFSGLNFGDIKQILFFMGKKRRLRQNR